MPPANKIEEEMMRFEAEISGIIKTDTGQVNDSDHHDSVIMQSISHPLPPRKFLGTTFPGNIIPERQPLTNSAVYNHVNLTPNLLLNNIRAPPPPPPSLQNSVSCQPQYLDKRLIIQKTSNLCKTYSNKNCVLVSPPTVYASAPKSTNDINDDADILSILEKTENEMKNNITITKDESQNKNKVEINPKIMNSKNFKPSSVTASENRKNKSENKIKSKTKNKKTSSHSNDNQNEHKNATKLNFESPSATSSATLPGSIPSYDGINAPAHASISDDTVKKIKKSKKIVRTGGGQVWEDPSLKEWDPNDFRIFCGDLGNDVTDEVLQRTFGRYPSFQKAKVIRDKKSNKTKGFGFVSFRDPADFTKAMREMNGKYVGSRPIKMRKSNWKDRNIEIVKQKQKTKQQMGYKW